MSTKRKVKKQNQEGTHISNDLFNWVLTLLNFKKIPRKQQVAVVFTILLLAIGLLYKETQNYRNQTYFNERILDAFIQHPQKKANILNIAVFQFSYDKTSNNEIPLQRLLIDGINNKYFTITRYRSPLVDDICEQAKSIEKYLKYYDIIIYGSVIQRDGNKKNVINIASKTNNSISDEFEIKNGIIPVECYNLLYSVVLSTMDYKIENLNVLAKERYNQRDLEKLSSFIYLLLSSSDIKKNATPEDVLKILSKKTEIDYTIGITEMDNRFLEETINDCVSIMDYEKNKSSFAAMDNQVQLGKAEYYLGLLNLSSDQYDEGIILLNKAIKTFQDNINYYGDFRTKWSETVKKFSTFLPKNITIKTNTKGEQYYNIDNTQDSKNSVAPNALAIIMTYENISSKWSVCLDYLSLCQFALGMQQNDQSLFDLAEKTIETSIAEKSRKHYLPNYDNPLSIETIFIPQALITRDLSLFKSYIDMKSRFILHTSKLREPLYWADLNNDQAIAIFYQCLIHPEKQNVIKGINLYKIILTIYENKSLQYKCYDCHRKLAELNLIGSLIDEANASSYNKKTINELRHAINFSIDKGYSTYFADNMLMLAFSMLINYKQTKDINILMTNIKLYSAFQKRSDFLYTSNSYSTLELANGIILYLTGLTNNKSGELVNALKKIDSSLSNFSHPCLLPLIPFANNFAGNLLNELYSKTKEENYKMMSISYFKKGKEEMTRFKSPLFFEDNLLTKKTVLLISE